MIKSFSRRAPYKQAVVRLAGEKKKIKKCYLLKLMTPFITNYNAKKRFLLQAMSSLYPVWISTSNQKPGSLESQVLMSLRTKLLGKTMVSPSFRDGETIFLREANF